MVNIFSATSCCEKASASSSGIATRSSLMTFPFSCLAGCGAGQGFVYGACGGPGRTRTDDRRGVNALLYQLSYRSRRRRPGDAAAALQRTAHAHRDVNRPARRLYRYAIQATNRPGSSSAQPRRSLGLRSCQRPRLETLIPLQCCPIEAAEVACMPAVAAASSTSAVWTAPVVRALGVSTQMSPAPSRFA